MERDGDAAVRASLIAAALGLLGAALFKSAGLGLNMTVWFLGSVAGLAYCSLRGGSRLPVTSWVGLALAGFASLGLGWYSSASVTFANWIAFFTGIGIAALGLHSVRIAAISFWDLFARLVSEPFVLLVDGLSAMAKVPWKRLSDSPLAVKNRAVFRGALIATPLLLLFGGLLSSADAVFSQTVTDAFSFDLAGSFEWGAIWIVCASLGLAIVGGFAVPTVRKPPVQGPPTAAMKIGMTEVSVVLCSLCGLFALFVAIQFRYLFGGNVAVVETTGLTYAEYARKGFFELVAVAGLMLPLLVGAFSVSRQESQREVLSFKVLSTVLTGLLFVVMASAMTRMQLYVESYGLTPLRVSSSAFMLWLALVFSWFLASLYRSAMPRFALGAVVAGFAVILGLNFATPDLLSARYNVARFGSSSELDAAHLSGLGPETVPFVLDSLARLSPEDQVAIEASYEQRYGDDVDWRGSSVGDLVAVNKLRSTR